MRKVTVTYNVTVQVNRTEQNRTVQVNRPAIGDFKIIWLEEVSVI